MREMTRIGDRRCINKRPKTWDIWYAYVPRMEDGIKSHAQNGYRPVLIISNNDGNNTSTEVNIFSLSSKIKKLDRIPVHVLVESNKTNGLTDDSIVLCEHADTIPKSCLKFYMGSIVEPHVKQAIQMAARKQMGIFEQVC